VTASKFNAQNNPLNLIVWNLQGEAVAKFEWKKHAKDAALFFHFAPDESFCARQSGPNCIEVYPNCDFNSAPLVVKQLPQISRKGNPKPSLEGVALQFHGLKWVSSGKK